MKSKYRKEKEDNDRLRAFLSEQAYYKSVRPYSGIMPPVTTVLPAATTVPVQPALPVETSQNITALTKAKEDKIRAERVVKEQEKIIKKLEDLLERSMHTVDKRKNHNTNMFITVLFART